jgi:hypothetical protein
LISGEIVSCGIETITEGRRKKEEAVTAMVSAIKNFLTVKAVAM